MKRIVYERADGGVSILTPAPGARLATQIELADGTVLKPASGAAQAVDQFLRGWPIAGAIASWAETEDEWIERIKQKDVPADRLASALIVDETALPAARAHRGAWRLVNGAVQVNAAAALEISRDRVDAEAEAARLRYVPQPEVVAEYQQAENEATAYKTAGYSGTVPPSVASWASAKAWTAQQAADDILAAAANLRGKLMQIRGVRLVGKEAIAGGTKTLDQVLAELAAL